MPSQPVPSTSALSKPERATAALSKTKRAPAAVSKTVRAKRSPLAVCLFAALSGACHGPEDVIEEPALDLASPPPPDLAAPPLPDLAPPPPPQPPVACGSVLPGPPIKPDVTEAKPGYPEELAALDLSTVPDPFDYSAESKLGVTVINYMLGRNQGTSVSHKDAMTQGSLGRAVLAAAAKGTAGRIDFGFLRRGLHYFYPCSRPLPGSLTELRKRYGDYKTWPVQELMCARPKDGPRRLYESHALGVYIAETVVNGQVRETEVLFTSLRQDGQLDFAAYEENGALSDRSTFATNGAGPTTLASPYTCISCHIDTTSWSISNKMPTGTGAGCR